MKIIITEAQYNRVISEQTTYTWSTPSMATTSHEDVRVADKYPCTNNLDISNAVFIALNEFKLPAIFVKSALGIIGRESNFGKITGESGWKKVIPSRYLMKSKAEYIMNKIPDDSSIKKIIVWGNKNILSKINKKPLETKDLSMGLAQITPSVAKKYGINVDNLMNYTGALIASASYLQDIYNSLSNYDENVPSIISSGNKNINNPNSTGNARLDATIISYNLGSSPLKKNFCVSTDVNKNNKGLRVNCNQSDANKNGYLKNYLPNYITKTNVGELSSHGYLKEVVQKYKPFDCIK